jgi:hypothetical protein
MELTIDFECPVCAGVFPLPLRELAPGQFRPCLNCGASTELTENSLRSLRERLELLGRN